MGWRIRLWVWNSLQRIDESKDSSFPAKRKGSLCSRPIFGFRRCGQGRLGDCRETPITSPNPAYRLVTGSGGNDSTLPFFQLLQDIDEDLRDPRILIVGYKYLLAEVSEGEVREMIRRSGRFNYKIIQDQDKCPHLLIASQGRQKVGNL